MAHGNNVQMVGWVVFSGTQLLDLEPETPQSIKWVLELELALVTPLDL